MGEIVGILFWSLRNLISENQNNFQFDRIQNFKGTPLGYISSEFYISATVKNGGNCWDTFLVTK